MFSQLGPLFRTQFRQAESNDTRQSIPHEERDQNRKKQEERKKNKDPDDAWTDNTSVSVIALRAFLIDFVKTIPGGEESNLINKIKNEEILPTRPKEKIRPTNTRNAKAVRAYQTMAAHTHTAPPDHPPTEKKERATDKIESKELRDIHTLIMDLEYLEKKGVTLLRILKAKNFVESLTLAVKLEKSKF